MFGAFLNPVTAAGGAEVERESAEMSQDVGLAGDRALRRVPQASIQPLSRNLY